MLWLAWLTAALRVGLRVECMLWLAWLTARLRAGLRVECMLWLAWLTARLRAGLHEERDEYLGTTCQMRHCAGVCA